MAHYLPPLQDMRFALRELVDLEAALARRPGADLTPDLVDSVLEEAGRFAAGVFAPTDRAGDANGARWEDGAVRTSPGFREAYRAFVDAGWHSLSCRPESGGQGFPRVVSVLVDEMWRSANMALTGCLALTRGAIEAIERRASDELRRRYLPPLVRGDWTGAMNLTEPQAGSDLSAIRSRAVPAADGSYRVFGQKIFISWGEHDLGGNIVHLVLARTPGAPAGVKGISMFLVPKFLVREDGSLGARNDVQCVAIERKAGQHGSPSAVLVYGERGVDGFDGAGAVGYLVGDLHRGLEIMFIMMNEARLAVGVEGLAISERAYQTALDYAKERVQGAEAGADPARKVSIIRHPDVRRMLMRMKASIEAMRALALVIAAELDAARDDADAARRAEANGFLDLMTPVFKAWNTETAARLTALGVQIHGGLGYMEECAASQHWKDARIMTIYEGTTAIQANDLVGRKIFRDGGRSARLLTGRFVQVAEALDQAGGAAARAIAAALRRAAHACERCVDFVLAHHGDEPRRVLAVAVPLLELMGIAAGGWQMGRIALAAHRRQGQAGADAGYCAARIATARFYAEHIMADIDALLPQVLQGSESVLALEDAQL